MKARVTVTLKSGVLDPQGKAIEGALKSLGVESQLVIYPNSYHGITLPSYRVDRLERYLKWYDRYLKPVTQ